MKPPNCITPLLLALLAVSVTASAELSPEMLGRLPAPAALKVDFARDIQPMFLSSCVQCHARGKNKGDFSLETREAFLKGGETGAAVVLGKSAESYVVEMISGFDRDIVMPQKGKKLTPKQVSLFRAWIDQGMPWPEGINFFKHEPANLRANAVAEPASKTGLENPVDRFVDASFAKSGTAWPPVVEDRVFARRVWLDAIGVLPTAAELEAFLADQSPDKRARLVAKLLADRQNYAEHWLTFWNDLLRNDYRGTGFIGGGRKQITGWLYTALARNLPYDQFVAQLVNPTPATEGFTKGIIWRGVVNASMEPPMQAAQGISQVFLGVNLKCASCHDSFINEYTLADAYGLASVYAPKTLELVECDKPLGHPAKVKFLYDGLGTIDEKADSAARKRQLAEVLTGPKNGRLPRTVVNRLWQRFMGHGLVEPVDEMDRPAWNPALLDWLAEDLVAHGYDLQHTMQRILTSRAYQLPAVNFGEKVEDYAFRGPAIRRMSAEQFSDGLAAIAGMRRARAAATINRRAALGGGATLDLQPAPKWIWNAPDANRKAKLNTVYFRREFELPEAPNEAFITVNADDRATITINGKPVPALEFIDARTLFQKGPNVITVSVANLLPSGSAPKPEENTPEAENPAGLLLFARIKAGGVDCNVASDGTWITNPRPQAGWDKPGFTQPWKAAVELGGVEIAPWKAGRQFLDTAAAQKDTLPVRAALLVADPLMAALGRPNREQIVTVRQAAATTLQALELTNGGTLAQTLKDAAQQRAAKPPADTAAWIEALYRHAISRPPTAGERTVALRLAGSPATAEGIEDLLWALTMQPEFQLIH